MVESCIAIFIALLAVDCFYLIVFACQKNKQEMELRTDRIYAYHVLKENDLEQIEVHDHIYERIGNKYLNDKSTNEKFKIES